MGLPPQAPSWTQCSCGVPVHTCGTCSAGGGGEEGRGAGRPSVTLSLLWALGHSHSEWDLQGSWQGPGIGSSSYPALPGLLLLPRSQDVRTFPAAPLTTSLPALPGAFSRAQPQTAQARNPEGRGGARKARIGFGIEVGAMVSSLGEAGTGLGEAGAGLAESRAAGERSPHVSSCLLSPLPIPSPSHSGTGVGAPISLH